MTIKFSCFSLRASKLQDMLVLPTFLIRCIANLWKRDLNSLWWLLESQALASLPWSTACSWRTCILSEWCLMPLVSYLHLPNNLRVLRRVRASSAFPCVSELPTTKFSVVLSAITGTITGRPSILKVPRYGVMRWVRREPLSRGAFPCIPPPPRVVQCKVHHISPTGAR